MKLSDDDFTLFGLAARQGLDREDLDARRRELQSQVHPDRFAAQGAAAQRLAMQWAVRVNQAHQRLKDPLSRAAYLCELRGVPVAAESNTAMPRDFLMQQMQWREMLEEAPDSATVEALDTAVAQQESAMLAELARLLDEHPDTAAAAARVRALMFVARFRQDIERRLEALDTTH
ncbi:MAG: Fe-S protein assembly co-chaperone HscB [Rubrivivax sp.]|nr:Fe-S protein assembly co-chaperone HscB [Rubrivivax sp.]